MSNCFKCYPLQEVKIGFDGYTRYSKYQKVFGLMSSQDFSCPLPLHDFKS